MTRPYPYYPAWDGGKASPVILRCVQLCERRYKTKNLGTYSNRKMRGKEDLSVHATGFACDISYAGKGKHFGISDEQLARRIWDFFTFNSKELGLAEMHWYNYGRNKGLFGCGYRCSRGEGKLGVKIYKTAKESAGAGGQWLHIELEDQDPDEFEAKFRALKPKDA